MTVSWFAINKIPSLAFTCSKWCVHLWIYPVATQGKLFKGLELPSQEKTF